MDAADLLLTTDGSTMNDFLTVCGVLLMLEFEIGILSSSRTRSFVVREHWKPIFSCAQDELEVKRVCSFSARYTQAGWPIKKFDCYVTRKA